MCCQIITLIFGIIALAKGEFSLTRTRVVSGTAARIIGGFLLLPLPLSLGLVFVLATVMATQGDVDENRLRLIGNGISAAVLVLCLMIAIGIAIFTAKPVKKRNPFEFDEDHDLNRRRGTEPPDEPGSRIGDDRGPDPDPPNPDPRFRAR